MNGPQLLMAQGCSLRLMTGPPAGSVRGVRSNPYPYRDPPNPHAEHGRVLRCWTKAGWRGGDDSHGAVPASTHLRA